MSGLLLLVAFWLPADTGVLIAADWASIRQQAYLKASNANAATPGRFGYSVAVSGNTVVVSAVGEASSATGVNGNQSDDSFPNSGAAYVFVRDGTNWTQQAYLKASNTDMLDQFGTSVAISGDTVVVGANWEDSNATGVNGDQSDNSIKNSGAAYVFVRSGTNWTQQAYLKASNTGGPSTGEFGGDLFGGSVTISGDIVVVGALNEDSNATGVNGDESDNSALHSGAAYVFARDGTNWSQQAYLKASNTEADDQFGEWVAVSGETVVVSARLESSGATGVNGNQGNNSATNSGAAYVFVRNGTNWTQQAYLKASNTEALDNFSVSLAMSGDTIVVGAGQEDSSASSVNGDQNNNSATNSGAAYVFVRNETTWTQQAYLKASNNGRQDRFGRSVTVSDDMAVVSAVREDSNATGVNGDQSDNSITDAGAAYVFVRNGTNWTQQAYLKASNPGVEDLFGWEVAVSGDTVVIGAPFEDTNATGVDGDRSNDDALNSGAAYVFTGLGNPLRLALAPDGGGGYFIRFKGIPGWTYEVQRATSVDGLWSTMDAHTAPASGVIEYHDTDPPNGQAFYRVAGP